MNTEQILAALDSEIQRLQQTRDMIAGLAGTKRRDRPAAAKRSAKRTLSAAAREKIAAAQRKRWAKQKEVVVTKLPPKRAPVKRPRRKSP